MYTLWLYSCLLLRWLLLMFFFAAAVFVAFNFANNVITVLVKRFIFTAYGLCVCVCAHVNQMWYWITYEPFCANLCGCLFFASTILFVPNLFFYILYFLFFLLLFPISFCVHIRTNPVEFINIFVNLVKG